MEDNIVLMTGANKYGNVVNISSSRVYPLYEYYRRRIKCPRWPLSDRQRFLFEKIIVNLCRVGDIRVKDWVIHHDRINAWNHPRWLESRSEGIPIDGEREILYCTVRDEIALINKALFWKATDKILTPDDYEVIERIELTSPALAAQLTELFERRKEA